MEQNKKFIKTTLRKFLNENDNYIPKQQPYGGFVSPPKSPSKLERAYPFMSTNIVGGYYIIKYWNDNFTDEMIKKLVKIFTGNDNIEIINVSNYHKDILIDGSKVGSMDGNKLSINMDIITRNKTILMKDVFPDEYGKYIETYS